MTIRTWMKTSCLWLACVLATPVWADRVKDLATLAAQRPNQLIGFGLVVGLQGTGDDASVPFTTQSMKALLAQMGVRIDGPMSDFEQVRSPPRALMPLRQDPKWPLVCQQRLAFQEARLWSARWTRRLKNRNT